MREQFNSHPEYVRAMAYSDDNTVLGELIYMQ